MAKNSLRNGGMPPLGMCLWLLTGKSLADRIKWLANNGLTGVSLLQNVIDLDEMEREEGAKAIVEAGLNLSFHANAHHKVDALGKLDANFVEKLIDNIIWWHENANGVASCCADAIRLPGSKRFSPELNLEYMTLLHARLSPSGIPIGIENAFASAYNFHSLMDFTDFKERCGSVRTGMLFDAAHANIHVRSDKLPGEDEIGQYFSKLPFDALEMHLSDNCGSADEHKPLGSGNLDLKSLLRAAKERDFQGQLTLEVCKDIASGQYASDISNPKEMDPILRSRDAVLKAWAEA